MKRRLLFCIILWGIFVLPQRNAHAALEVIDTSAIAQLIKQIKHTLEIIKQLESLNEWANIDHMNLSESSFNQFLTTYTSYLNDLIAEINGYQNGGLLGQIERLDEVYFSYYDGWESQGSDDYTNKADPHHAALKKQLLWTRIQLKHAAKVAAKVRDSLPQTQAELQALQVANFSTVGIIETLKIGNEITGVIARGLETLNTQMGEVLQAQAADGLEKNTREGLQKNRARDALFSWGEDTTDDVPAPLNPFGAY